MPHTSEVYPKSKKAKLKLPFNQADDELFYFGRRFSAGTWPSPVSEWASRVLAMGSPVIADLAEGVPRTCTV